VTYDEARAVVSWSAAAVLTEASSAAQTEPADPTAPTVLPSTPIGMPSAPTTGYYVYELAASEDAAAPRVPQRLTEKPVTGTAFEDERIVWGAERCYAVSVVRRFDSLSVESEASLPRCVTFSDTFPPPVPTNVTAVASAGAISLIWDPSKAADLAGYIVLRGTAAAAATALTASPVQEASFRDTTVTAGDQYVYSVRAVDKAGNLSAPSEPVEETAR
jgi:hypothetical protein